MYVRQAKQFLRNAIDAFDERKYGFASVVDLLRAAGKEGVVRIERDRQGAVRVFPGPNLMPKVVQMPQADVTVEEPLDLEIDAEPAPMATSEPSDGVAEESVLPFVAAERVDDAPIVDADPVPPGLEADDDMSEEDEVNGNRIDVEPARPAAARKRKTPSGRTGARTATPRAPRTTPRSSTGTRTPAPRAAGPRTTKRAGGRK